MLQMFNALAGMGLSGVMGGASNTLSTAQTAALQAQQLRLQFQEGKQQIESTHNDIKRSADMHKSSESAKTIQTNNKIAQIISNAAADGAKKKAEVVDKFSF